MERKLLTVEELVVLEGISAEDKVLIEAAVMDSGGEQAESPNTLLRLAIRGYLAQEFLDENEPDDQLRKELDGDAASFADGWAWHEEHGQ